MINKNNYKFRILDNLMKNFNKNKNTSRAIQIGESRLRILYFRLW